MANKLTFTDGVSKNLKKLSSDKASDDWGQKASDQLLVLSRREVPFGIKRTERDNPGSLSQSGFSGKDREGYFVAYTEEYAAYQHEGMRADGSHVVRRWNNGRKSKYLEDPLKENLSEWRKLAGSEIKTELKKL